MDEFIWIVAATITVSMISFVGAFTLVLSENKIKKVLLTLVGFAAGALIGGAFLHLIPESVERSAAGELHNIFLTVVLGFVLFFVSVLPF